MIKIALSGCCGRMGRTVARMADGKQLDWHYDQRHKTLSGYGTAQYDVITVTR